MSETFSFNFTEEDIKSAELAKTLVDDGWYTLNILKAEKERSSKGDSFNLVVTFEIEKSESGSVVGKGKRLMAWISEKAMGFAITQSFFAALKGENKLTPGAGEVTVSGLAGRKIGGYVTRQMGVDKSGRETGALVNTITDYKAAV